MALRRSATGQQSIYASCEATADDLFEQHLPKLALFCLRFTQDKEQAARLAERVLQKARRNIASSRVAPSFSGWLYSVLREECLAPVRVKSVLAAAEPLGAAEEVP
jgi:DNA-directed RNA polymerase specialized sigma24 family protein